MSLALALVALLASGCVFIDDFGKFKVDPNKHRDAGPGSGEDDAGPSSDRDAQADAASKCSEDCSKLANDCTSARCDEASGECRTEPMREGESCFDDNPCTFAEKCGAGTCLGQALDCSGYDDECSQGICDREAGGCTFGPNRMSQSCDDFNPCTLDDRCDSRGFCVSDTNAASGTACDDFNTCSGVAGMPDRCNGSGRCLPGAPVAAGTSCNDDNECSSGDVCDGEGACAGMPTREGERCHAGCSGNTTCQSGTCLPTGGGVAEFNPGCFLNWCDDVSLCSDSWQHDRVCDCGCPFTDPDCGACSARVCQNAPDLNHRATSWCNQNGEAVDNCPDSLKNDGKCDCGCQFQDPDCAGGSCCGPTGTSGCNNRFIELCVCEHETNAQPDCCNKEWTQACADLARNLGCMLCD